jgi:ABC-type multidrug transport system ATPase subunit
MLDFYGALSGMDSGARRKRIPELLATVGLSEARSSKVSQDATIQAWGLEQGRH